MEPPSHSYVDTPLNVPPRNEAHSSGVSWGAVIGGAFVAAALSLILLALGAGFDLLSVSPWSNSENSLSRFGIAAIVWFVVVQAIASAMGGYLTGRLRTKWVAVHTDEVYFRDTANGFLSWAVALVLTVSFLTTAAGFMAGGGPRTAASNNNPTAVSTFSGYYVDALFRSQPPKVTPVEVESEAGRILDHVLATTDASPSEADYLAQLVTANTGMNAADSQRRVSTVLTDARQAEDTARKAIAHALLSIFLALLLGAFCASFGATVGGRQRDHERPI